MNAAIVTIGSELLTGRIADTNAQFLASQMSKRGVRVVMHISVDDRSEEIADALAVARARAGLVLITGGLGPTADDITAASVAKFLGRRLVEDAASAAAIRQWYSKRGTEPHEGALRQAMLPEGACAIPNPVGIAPGFTIREADKIMAALPGVPAEMRAMAETSIFPWLEPEGGPAAARTLKFAGIPEAAVDLKIRDIWESLADGETFALQAAPGEIRLRMTAAAQKRLDALEAEVRAKLSAHLFGRDEDELETVVFRLLKERGLKLAAAESVTGGLIAQRMTSVPGSSAVFHGSCVAYMEGAKRGWLGIPAELLALKGAVSREIAGAMAEKAMNTAGADLGISTTGWAGPGGGDAEDPVGTVYIGLADRNGTVVERGVFGGNREAVRTRASSHALYMIWRKLSGGKSG